MGRRGQGMFGKLAMAGMGVLCLCLLSLGDAWAGPVEQRLQQVLQPQLQAAASLRDASADAPQAVARFYEQRQWQPVWDEVRFAALLVQLRALEADGLNPADYGLAELGRYQGVGDDPAKTVERELRATRAYLLALEHLSRGKVNPVALDPDWNFDTPRTDREQGLALAREAVENGRLDEAFQAARPATPQYARMQGALTDLRRLASQGGWPVLPEGKALKPGMQDPRVLLLRQRLQLAGLLGAAAEGSAARYDKTLEAAVQRFQQRYGLDDDGVLGKDTLRELNIPVEQRIAQLRANLERMRWHLRETRGDHVIVDVAGYRIAYMQEGHAVWESRVQVGRNYRKTPIFQSAIAYITLNPRWKVPPTILRKDMLPAIRRHHDYLAKNHLRVFDARGNELAPETINWAHPGAISLVQDAGPEAALGQVAIRFPNPYSVYLHETPHQELFKSSQRAFSSGCIRVENVRELAVLLLNDPQAWNRDALEAAIAEGRTRDVGLPKKIPVLIAYWTADVGEDGQVSFRPDVYGQDAVVVEALDGAWPGPE